MKKTISLLTMLLLAVSLVSAGTVDLVWDGGGILDIDVESDGDQRTQLVTDGSLISGNFKLTDNNNNPYNYGVDTVNVYSNNVVSSGSTTFQIDRTDSTSQYGSAGQQMYAFVGSDGTASMATGAVSNYAGMISATYGKPKTLGGYNFEAVGTNFQVIQQVTDGSGDGAYVNNYGSGSSKINAMSSEMKGSNFKLGKGAGCYTNANVASTGTGFLEVVGWSDNGLNADSGSVVIPGDGSDNSATYDLTIGYSGNFNYGNFALEGS